MEFTICDASMMELGALPDSVSLDFDIGKKMTLRSDAQEDR